MTSPDAPSPRPPASVPTPAPRLIAGLNWLIEPPAFVTGAARRESRLLNMIVLVIAVALVGVLALRTVQAVFPALGVVVELVILAGLYALNRRGYYLPAAGLLVTLLLIHPLLIGITMPGIDLSHAVIWLGLPILLSSVLLPMPGMLTVTAAAVIGAAAAPMLAPSQAAENYANSLLFIVGFSALAVGLTRHRIVLEQDRQAEARHTASLEVKLEEERVVSAMALQVARIRSEFVANVSHELRTPLNSILGFSEMMLTGLAGPLDERVRKMVDRIHSNGLRLLDLINDILDLSKIEAQSTKLNLAPLSPRDMARGLQMQFVQQAIEKQVTILVEIEPDLPETILTDHALIEKIGTHLLSNAVKFTEKGRVTVSMGLISKTSWYLKVLDTGIGIPAQALTFIFDPFRQVDGSSTRRYGGAGVGLTLVHELTRLMGGQLHVESCVGEGSCFTVVLPLTYPEHAESVTIS